MTRGKKYYFLGMNITITNNRTIEIEMKDQLQEIIDMFASYERERANEIVSLPARKHLRDVNDKCKNYLKKGAWYFIKL